MYVRVCAFNGCQLQSRNPQCCLPLHLYRLTMAVADARGRCASVSSLPGHLGVNRWKPGQPIQKNSLPDCHRSLYLPWLERRRNAKGVLPISDFQSFLPPPASSKPTDIESPETEDRKFGLTKYRNYLLRERGGTAKWKLQRENINHFLNRGNPPAPFLCIPLLLTRTSGPFLHPWTVQIHRAEASSRGSLYYLEQVFRYSGK